MLRLFSFPKECPARGSSGDPAPQRLQCSCIGFEVDYIAAVFLQGEDFLDGGMVPLGRLQRAFGSALVEPLAGSIG